MKVVVMCVLILFGGFWCKAQQNNFSATALIQPFDLQITTAKTTVIIFPANIQSADRGDRTVLAEKVKGTENVLKVKAADKTLTQSNLHVITSDGKVYSFNVQYSDDPAYQTIDLRRQAPYAPVTFQNVSLNSKQLADAILRINSTSAFMHQRGSSNGIRLKLEGVFLSSDVLFFRFNLANTSAIDYEISSIRFFIRDKHRMKRTSEQDRELLPISSSMEGSAQSAKGETITIAFPKFTIAEGKRLVAELTEQNGDRNLSLKISENQLLKARPVGQ